MGKTAARHVARLFKWDGHAGFDLRFAHHGCLLEHNLFDSSQWEQQMLRICYSNP